MTLDAMRLQFRYAAWATGKVFDAAEQLTAEQRSIPGHAGHGSIHDTLRHLLEVHLRWWAWFDGSLPPEQAIMLRFDDDEVAELASLRARWDELQSRTMALLGSLTEDDFNRSMHVETPWTPSKDMPLWALLLHVANHEAQHRSEVAAMLSEHGASPGYLDLLFFVLDPANDVTF